MIQRLVSASTRALALLATSLATGAALVAQEPVDRAMISKLRAESDARSQVLESYRMLTDVIGPRLTGTPGFKRSVDWTRDRMVEWGMSNVAVESWPFGRGWTLEKLTLEMTAPRYFPLEGYPEAWTPSTAGRPQRHSDLPRRQDGGPDSRRSASRLKGAIVLPQPPQEADKLISADRNRSRVTRRRACESARRRCCGATA
jgi:hypothetical protein